MDPYQPQQSYDMHVHHIEDRQSIPFVSMLTFPIHSLTVPRDSDIIPVHSMRRLSSLMRRVAVMIVMNWHSSLPVVTVVEAVAETLWRTSMMTTMTTTTTMLAQ